MIKKIMLASCLLVASMASQAALISYNGYERDTANNYVTGGGLEWLMWDVTKGSSISQAITDHGSHGWKLASNQQMATLLNTFQFRAQVWKNEEHIEDYYWAAWQADEAGPFMRFMDLFGVTESGSGYPYLPDDPWAAAKAWYGDDADGNGRYNTASVVDDHTYNNIRYSAIVGLSKDWYSSDTYHDGSGVALVREVRVIPTAQVSLPGSLSLLALGLVALGVRRRQASSR